MGCLCLFDMTLEANPCAPRDSFAANRASETMRTVYLVGLHLLGARYGGDAGPPDLPVCLSVCSVFAMGEACNALGACAVMGLSQSQLPSGRSLTLGGRAAARPGARNAQQVKPAQAFK
ncbi:hypothetical protein FKM82_029018 [Ascaphus truei]